MKTLKEAYNEIIESNLNNPEERETYLQDLTQNGAISGMVGGLVYYYEKLGRLTRRRSGRPRSIGRPKQSKLTGMVCGGRTSNTRT